MEIGLDDGALRAQLLLQAAGQSERAARTEAVALADAVTALLEAEPSFYRVARVDPRTMSSEDATHGVRMRRASFEARDGRAHARVDMPFQPRIDAWEGVVELLELGPPGAAACERRGHGRHAVGCHRGIGDGGSRRVHRRTQFRGHRRTGSSRGCRRRRCRPDGRSARVRRRGVPAGVGTDPRCLGAGCRDRAARRPGRR